MRRQQERFFACGEYTPPPAVAAEFRRGVFHPRRSCRPFAKPGWGFSPRHSSCSQFPDGWYTPTRTDGSPPRLSWGYPGLIFHWKYPRFFSEELRWLATYVALSRPPSLAQLISVGLPDELRSIIESGPPEGILSRFDDMFKEKEEATHIKAAEILRELGWDRTPRLVAGYLW